MEKASIVLFWDMDGVLADFVGGAGRLFGRPGLANEWPAHTSYIVEALGLSASEFWRVIDAEGSDFWANLEANDDALDELVRLQVKGHEPYLLTSPSLSPDCLHGKLRWIKRYLPNLERRTIFTAQKHLLAAPGRGLIDDRVSHVRKFEDEGGLGFVWDQPWNRRKSWAGLRGRRLEL